MAYDIIRILDGLSRAREQLKEETIVVNTLPLSSLTEDIVHSYDTICVHGAFCAPLVPVLKKTKFCLFIDDLMTNIPKGNPAVLSRARRMAFDWAVGAADHVVCTTEQLKKCIGREDALVVPNLIDLKWQDNNYQDVLYSGGSSHTKDIQLLGDLQTERKVIFFTNTLPHKLSHFYQDDLGNVVLRPSKKNIGFIPIQSDYERYQVWFNNLEFGVGVAPLLDNDFNHCKSIFKFLEYTNKGAVSVVSDIMPYSSIPDNCVVKVKDNDWDAAIEQAFENHKELYFNAYNWVKNNWTYDVNNAWLEMYRTI